MLNLAYFFGGNFAVSVFAAVACSIPPRLFCAPLFCRLEFEGCQEGSWPWDELGLDIVDGWRVFFALLTAAHKAIEQASRFYFLALEAQLYILFGISLIALHF